MRVKMENDTIHLFVKSIEEELNMKMSKVHSSIQLLNKPTTNGEVFERSITSADTIITKKVSTGGHKENMFNSFVTILRLENMLHTDTLSLIFQNNLIDNGIHATSFILLEYNDRAEISGDTTNFPISFRTPILKRGFSNEITYQALIHYTPLTIIQMIPLYLFFIYISVVCLILISWYYLSIQSKTIRPDKIMKLKNGDYYIGLVYYNKQKKMFRIQNKTVYLASQSAAILEFFLDSADFTANKVELQNEFWKTATSYNSMTSAINKLRTYLKDVDSTFEIITPKGREFYKLEYCKERGV